VSNVSTPNGFQQFGRLEGGSPTAGLTVRKLSAFDVNPVGYGDPVNTVAASGYVTRSAPGAQSIAGIFYGCSYLSKAAGKTIWSPQWIGATSGTSSDAIGDIIAYINDDPAQLFVAQANGGPITMADFGANVNFLAVAIAVPNQFTGFSTNAIDVSTKAVTNTLAFRIVGLLSDYVSLSNTPNGLDNTSDFNRVIVAPNNWDRKQLTGVN
jgi:hypothetical protein